MIFSFFIWEMGTSSTSQWNWRLNVTTKYPVVSSSPLLIIFYNKLLFSNYHTIFSFSMCSTQGLISGLLPQKGLLAQHSQARLVNYTFFPTFPSPVTDSEINWRMIQIETRSFPETLNVDIRMKLIGGRKYTSSLTLFCTNFLPIFHFQSQEVH